MTGAFGLVALIAHANLLYLLLAMMLTFLLCSGLLPGLTLRRLSIQQIVPRRVYAGKSAPYHVVIRNLRRAVPSYALTVAPPNGGEGLPGRHFLLKLSAGESVSLEHSLTIGRRGWHRLPGVSVSTGFPFGLFTKRCCPLPDRPILVFPAIRPITPLELSALAVTQEREGRRRGQSSGLHSLRDYRDDDDPRFIHWKSSARVGSLMLREPEAEESPKLSLLVEDPMPGAPSSLVEANISLAASLAVHTVQRGWEVQLVLADSQTKLGSDEPHLDWILQQLALYEPPARPRPLPFVNSAGAIHLKLDDPDPLRREDPH